MSLKKNMDMQPTPCVRRASARETHSDAETKTLFRNLVTGQIIPDMSYALRKFSFQTVFFISHYHYRCCPCAYEHEYLEHLFSDGRINHTIYERVEANILRGRCPHVKDAPNKCITETAIHGIHIATVLGTNSIVIPERSTGRLVRRSSSVKDDRKTLRSYLNERETRGAIFKLDAFETALVKGRISFDELVQMIPRQAIFLYASRSVGNEHLLQVQPRIHLGFCRGNPNAKGLTKLLKTLSFTEFNSSLLKFAVQFSLADLQKALMKSVSKMPHYWMTNFKMVQIPVVYDKPEILDEILTRMKTYKNRSNLLYFLLETCSLLKRKSCETVALKHAKCTKMKRETETCTMLFYLLYEYYDEIKNERLGLIEDYGNKNWQFICPKSHAMCGFGFCVKCPPTLTGFLEHFLYYSNVHFQPKNIQYQRVFRDILETIIFLNPSITTEAVNKAIQCDEKYQNQCGQPSPPWPPPWQQHFLQPGCYQMDSNEYPLFWSIRENIALNFAGPLLIESGYYPTKELLDTIIVSKIRDLHPAEYRYLQQCTEVPISLKNVCRMVLRRHFTGQEIHRFVAHANIPRPVGDFILMTPLLKRQSFD